MYDLDVITMFERLQKIPNATLLCSNPCFELWLLLHYTDQRTELTSDECVNRLAGFIKQYKKGALPNDAKAHLLEKIPAAMDRAKNLTAHKNPSTTVYNLIEDLNKLNNQPFLHLRFSVEK